MTLKARFIGDPNERDTDVPASRRSIEWFGLTFPAPHFDRPAALVDISGLTEEQQAKIAANTHFEVVGAEAAAADDAPEGTVIDEGNPDPSVNKRRPRTVNKRRPRKS